MLPYRDRVRVLYRAEAHGEETPDWDPVQGLESIACNIVAAGGGETNRGRQVEEHITHEVEMRLGQQAKQLAEDMAFEVIRSNAGYLDGRVLQIRTILPVDRRGKGNRPELLCHCVDSGAL